MDSPKNRLDLSLQIVMEILSDVTEEKATSNKKEEKQESDSGEGDDTEGSEGSFSSDLDDILGGTEGESPISENTKPEESEEPSDLSDKKKQKIEKAIQKQEAIVNRTHAKTPFDSKVLSKLQALEKSGVNIVPVGKEEGIPSIDCIVVNNLTKELMDTSEFPYNSGYKTLSENPTSVRGIREGISIGTMLGRRLQVRSEVKTTKFTRLDKGKIDRRLISALGYSGENLFYQTAVDKYKKVHLHISVDASSSMSSKWEKTMTTLVAIAKAASMIDNVSVSISFRSGVYISNKGRETPYIVIGYDSRKDKFSKITQLFPMLFPNGSTPEGLAFQAILDQIPQSTYEMDSYFVNLSDGEPAFNPGYFGEIASRHTRKQVGKMIENGVEVISYYIEHNTHVVPVNVKNFKTMYGKDAQFIDVKNIVQIAHSLNKKFLSKKT
jgi:hypothetical protein